MTAKTPHSKKVKGRAYEVEVMKDIMEAYPELSPNDISARPMGNVGIDLLLSDKARSVFPFAVECKRVEKLNIWDAFYNQAVPNAETERLIPCVVRGRNNGESLIIMRFADFLRREKQ